MIKKILRFMGMFVLLIIGLVSLMGAWTYYKASAYESTAVPYVVETVSELSKWDVEVAKQYMAPEVMKTVSDEDWHKLFKFLSKMGRLNALEEPVFTNIRSVATIDEGAMTLVQYSVLGHYENGDANITIVLKDLEDSFEVFKFSLNSLALVE